MSDPMAEIRASFFVECEELLESLQDALTQMEGGDTDSETINIAFRAVHSIKGGAGAFGLDQLVAFAHKFESSMDEVRAGALTLDESIITTFFQCADTLSDLVKSSQDGEDLDASSYQGLVEQLAVLAGGEDEPEEEVSDFQPMGISLDLPPLDIEPDVEASQEENLALLGNNFEIYFAPEPELYRSANDPIFLLRSVQSLGETTITCEIGDLPNIAEYGANSSVLAWRIRLTTNSDEAAILAVFEFVDGLCTLEIQPATPDDAPGPTVVMEVETSEPPNTDQKEEIPEASADAETTTPELTKQDKPGKTTKPSERTKPPASSEPTQPKSNSQAAATVRVDLDRVDRLVNLVGELVINQAMLSQSISAAGLVGDTKIETGLDELQQLTRNIQDSVMMIRAQPVKSLFQRMGRIVREASASVDKQVKLVTEGETTEIDKTVIERLSDPLTHMIRNAVDHGLETTADRIAAGKSEIGNVTLSASHRSGRVIIEVGDDGGGINRDRVRSIAEEKELIPVGQDLSDSEIDNLLFLPGFSTAKEISNLSGRGVGMDVVRNSIGALGGRISISSHPGNGTTFSISLPLTLAVLDGMVVTIGEETLVMPLTAVSETLSVGEDDVRSIGPLTQVIQVRDTFVPLIDLATELGYSPPRSSYSGAIVLLISQEDGNRAALVVDGIEDQRQVVIKGLQDSYGHVPGVAAATILGDGQIALILDPSDLLQNASGHTRPAPELTVAG
jgi:two-component system chemotaxis sensor kinase CheA